LTTSTSEGEPLNEPNALREPDPDPDPVATSARKQRQRRRLPADAACGLCGEADPTLLIQVKPPKPLLQGHHVGARNNDPDTLIVLCLNDHLRATNAQLDVGALTNGPAPSMPERLTLWLKSIGSFFELLAKSCYRFAACVAVMIAMLEANHPGWRHWPGMQ
jgi:hypothetical protein